jgi:hypothetical protein
MYSISAGAFIENDALSSSRLLETPRVPHLVLRYCRSNPFHLDSELQHFPETSIPGMNPAAGMQNLAVLFHVHMLRRCDPFPMNGRAMNRSRRHRGCEHAQPYNGDFWIYFPGPFRKLGCVGGCKLGSSCRSSSRSILCVFSNTI